MESGFKFKGAIEGRGQGPFQRGHIWWVDKRRSRSGRFIWEVRTRRMEANHCPIFKIFLNFTLFAFLRHNFSGKKTFPNSRANHCPNFLKFTSFGLFQAQLLEKRVFKSKPLQNFSKLSFFTSVQAQLFEKITFLRANPCPNFF